MSDILLPLSIISALFFIIGVIVGYLIGNREFKEFNTDNK